MASTPTQVPLSSEQMDDLARRVAAIQARTEGRWNPLTVTLAGALFAGLFAIIGWTALETQANGKAVVALQKDIAALQEDVATLQENVAALQAGQAKLQEGMQALLAGQEALNRRLDRMTR